MIKKLVCIVLTMLMVFGLVACSADETATESESTEATESTSTEATGTDTTETSETVEFSGNDIDFTYKLCGK